MIVSYLEFFLCHAILHFEMFEKQLFGFENVN